MPEAAVDEYDFSAAPKCYVRFAWKVGGVEPVPKAHLVNNPSDYALRCRILRANLPHVFRAVFGSQRVGHFPVPVLIRYVTNVLSVFV